MSSPSSEPTLPQQTLRNRSDPSQVATSNQPLVPTRSPSISLRLQFTTSNGNGDGEGHAHASRNLVINPDLLSPIG